MRQIFRKEILAHSLTLCYDIRHNYILKRHDMKTKLSLLVFIRSITFNCIAQSNIKEDNFNFKISENGTPVVVFESGLGEILKGWGQIQDSISKTATTVSYDRLGLGKSSATEKPRSIDNLANELNNFLEDNKINGPYILVGHS